MELFRRILFAAALAGLLGGVFVTALQSLGVIPLILRAETFETAAAKSEIEPDHDAHGAWTPADGGERLVFTWLANTLTGVGFGLLLTAVLAVRGKGGWRSGLLLGAGGFLCFTLAPSLGLPPELPGTEVAGLSARQIWWAATVIATATGLALCLYIRHPLAAIAGIAVAALPHLVGAPQPVTHASLAPESLAHAFLVTALVTSFAFWLVLGAAAGFFYERLVTRAS